MLYEIASALVSLALLAGVFVPLENVFPARAGQRTLRPGFAVDLCFFFGQYLLFSGVAVGVLSGVRSLMPATVLVELRAPLMKIPLWIQVIGAVMLGDLLVYWFHRACHRFDWLWRFHAVHHSAEHLDWLAAHREHPFDAVASQLCLNLPAMVMGFPIALLAGFAVLRGMWAIFVHSNVRLPLGPLRVLLGAPEVHHWHHARVRQTRHNFANLAPWLDMLFGTYHCPEGEETYELGIEEPMPRGYFAQLLYPIAGRPIPTTISSTLCRTSTPRRS